MGLSRVEDVILCDDIYGNLDYLTEEAHSLHLERTRPCSHIPDPLHSLQ